MKFIIILALLLPFALSAQTTDSYGQAMNKFQKFYNAGQGDSIRAMFEPVLDEKAGLFTNDDIAVLLKEFGSLKSYRFLGIDTDDPQKVYVFQTFFSKAGGKTTSLTLKESDRVGTFRFDTTSDGIMRLLQNQKTKH